MFGVKSIRREKQVDLVVTLKVWHDVPEMDRLGMDDAFVKILGVEIPHIVIPVRPGRDLARLIEVAAYFQTKLKASRLQPGPGIERPVDRQDAQCGQIIDPNS